MKRTRNDKIIDIAGAILLLVFCLAPFAYMILISLADSPDFLAGRSDFKLTFLNYRNVAADRSLHFPDYMKNSLIVSLLSASVCVVCAALSAYAFTRFRFRFRKSIFLFILAVSLFPQIGIIGYLFRLMTDLGWINTYQSLIFPYIAWTMPLSLWIMISYFRGIPIDLEEAAMVDGCSALGVLIRIIVPIAAPAVFSVLLLAFILAFNEFMFALMLTTDYRARTIPVGIALFQGMHGQIPWPEIMAASVITTAPVVIITLIFQRKIVSGLTKGAVKG